MSCNCRCCCKKPLPIRTFTIYGIRERGYHGSPPSGWIDLISDYQALTIKVDVKRLNDYQIGDQFDLVRRIKD